MKCIGILLNVRKKLIINTLRTLYNALILPYLSYCITIWGNTCTYDCYTSKIVLLQKKILRIITFSNRIAHTAQLFSRLNIMKFEHLYKYNVNSFMFNYLHHKLPICYEIFFTYKTDLYEYNTRRRNNVSLIFRKLVICRMGLKYNGPRLWNLLDRLSEMCLLSIFSKKP